MAVQERDVFTRALGRVVNSAFALQEVGRGGISPAEPIAAHLESRDAKPCYSELSPGQRQKTTRAATGTVELS